MKLNPICGVALLLSFLPLVGARGEVAARPESAKTLSPYFLVKTPDGSTDVFPLKATDVHVQIAGVIADVRVKQTYSNAGAAPIEAVYVFPASTRAAVHGLQVTIGERVLHAKVQRRDEARQTYESAKTEGKSSALLEQQRPNVFQMNVANIHPGDTIDVELRYTELLVPTAGEYEFVFPTVVGPRYSNRPELGAPPEEKWVQNPYLTKGTSAPSGLHLHVDITAPMPLQDVRCVTHEITPKFRDASHAVLETSGHESSGADRDFIVHYRLADGEIASGLLLAEGEKENFFLLTVQPPKRGTNPVLPPREYIFVVDVSGSMNGFPLTVSKELIQQLLRTLAPTDSFNVILFAGDSTMLAPASIPATAENVARAMDIIDRQRGSGGTELLPALRRALGTANKNHDAARSVIVITDGFVQVETEAFDLIRGNLNQTNVFTFGIGSSVNRFLIEGMARAGQGEPFIVTRPDEAAAQAAKFRTYVSSPLLTHVTVDFGEFEVAALEPSSIPDLLAERPVVVFGKWKGEKKGTISVRGMSGTGEYVQKFALSEARALESTPALAYLWARHRIATLGDYNQVRASDERVHEVTNLGLTYNLLTAYTSFVAVDELIRRPGVPAQLVKQALPLPQGVENSAVGAQIATTPEPGAWLILCVLVAVIGFHRARRTA